MRDGDRRLKNEQTVREAGEIKACAINPVSFLRPHQSSLQFARTKFHQGLEANHFDDAILRTGAKQVVAFHKQAALPCGLSASN